MRYEVLRVIEYNGKLYVPAPSEGPVSVRSAGNGSEIPVDRTGVIELTDQQAKQMTLDQVAPIKAKADSQKTKGKMAMD